MKYPPYKFILAFLDFLFVRLSFSIALLIQGASRLHNGNWSAYLKSTEFFVFFILSFLAVVIFHTKNLYKINVVLSGMWQVIVVFISTVYAIVGLAFVAFFIRSDWIVDSRLVVLYFAVISFSLVAGYRVFIFRHVYVYLNKKALTKKRVLIIGSDTGAKGFAVEMKIGNIYGFQLVGFVDDKKEIGTPVYGGYTVVGKVGDIPGIVRQYDIDEIIIAESAAHYDDLLQIIDLCKSTGAHVNVASPLFEVVHKKFSVDSYFDIPVAPLRSLPANDHIMMYKRIADILGSLVGLILLAVPLVLIALLVKLTSKGPVFYKQERIGKDGKPFNFYKFRSMRVGSDQDEGRITKMREFIRGGNKDGNGSTKVVNEHMITPIGKFLRKTSLDELPQFYNVLKGEMSLVGPRPCLPYEYKMYDEWHKRRLSVLPGCTGLWQVSGRSETGFDEMVVLDLYYIGNISFIFDIQLILKTIPVMMFGRGAK